MTPADRAIPFPAGDRARVVEVAPDLDGEELFRRLRLPEPRGTVILNGSTAELRPHLVAPLGEVIAGVARFAVYHGLTVVTGATDAGIFSVLGSAMERRSAPLVGVAPAGLVGEPGEAPEPEPEQNPAGRERLEPHHSHFVLVDGDEWGDETQALLALAGALGSRAPSAAVLCGGGAGARVEILGHCRAGRPVIVIAGSGRFADELAAAVSRSGEGVDPAVAEMVDGGEVVVCGLEDGPAAVTRALSRALGLTG
ncbi:MAG: hypothetical protein ACR2HV_10065 [Acidimicrobiales bacterium]